MFENCCDGECLSLDRERCDRQLDCAAIILDHLVLNLCCCLLVHDHGRRRRCVRRVFELEVNASERIGELAIELDHVGARYVGA